MSPAAQRAVEWLEQQISDLNEIRNATARDPSFKNWRQATLTALQRIWAGDQSRIERFRRIPFSPVDPRADARLVRESYSRGCQEAGRVLKTLIEEIEREGVPVEVRDTNDVAASEFEDGFPTVDLPLGDVVATKDPAALVADLMGDMGDLPPQGQDPSSPAPPRLQVEVPPPAPAPPTMAERLAMEAAAAAPPAPPTLPAPPALPVAPASPVAPVVEANAAPGAPRKGLNMKARLKDLLGFAQLSAKALAGFPRENDAPLEEPNAPLANAPVIPAVAVTPTPVVPPTPAPAPAIMPTPAPPAPASTGAMSEEVSAMLDAWPPKPTHERTPEVIGPVGPIAPIALTPPVVASVSPPAAKTPPAAIEPPAAVPPPPASEIAGSDAGYESPSVIMSRPTTLRASIEKVSIDSLISPEFRDQESGEPVARTPEPQEPVAEQPVAPEPIAPEPPTPPVERPSLTLVPPPAPPVIDDPEFMIDPTPSASLPKPSAHVPVPGHAVPSSSKADVSPPTRIVPVPAPSAAVPPSSASTPARDSFDDPLEGAMGAVGDVPASKPDPEAFARAAEDFMKSSPVLGASPRRVTRAPHDEHGFGDPDALAVASIIHDLGDMGVPEARYAETRARLLDLARRLERGELDWGTLRKAVWFAMEYPDLARRLMPVLLPWMDRAA